MKNFVALAMCFIMAFTSCSKEDENNDTQADDGSITLVCKEQNPIYEILTFNKEEEVTVDWGDGSSVEKMRSIEIVEEGYEAIYYIKLTHEYPADQPHTIKIMSDMKIKEFYADYSELASLDVSKNPVLSWLICVGNDLTSLDISKNTALEMLVCCDNNLTSIDLSKNTALLSLDCHENKLTSLDISKNKALKALICFQNNLSASALNKIYTDLPQRKDGKIYAEGNPGYEASDKNIAINKGWVFSPMEDELSNSSMTLSNRVNLK